MGVRSGPRAFLAAPSEAMKISRDQRARSLVAVVCGLVFVGMSAREEAQEPAAAATPTKGIVLRVEGQIDKPLSLSLEDLRRRPRCTFDARDHDGNIARYEGVTLAEILKAAGAPLAERLRGVQLSKFVLVEATDGYRAVCALPELDPAFTDERILVADHRDGHALSAAEGPLRLVVPHEKRQARWVRQVTAVKVLQADP